MSILKSTLITTALVFGSATTVFAQDAVMDKAKDMAIDKGVDMAKDKAIDTVGESGSTYVDPAAKVGKNMLKGDSAKDAVIGAVTSESQGISLPQGAPVGMTVGDSDSLSSTSLSTDEAVTAGKVIMKGGSTEDAAMAVAKERAKDQIMEKVDGLVTTTVAGETNVSEGSVIDKSTGVTTDPNGTVAPVAPSVPAAAAVNCPYGTTAQPNGTCMITGDYKQ